MAAPSKQVRLNFEKLTESGLNPILKKMEKWGLKVASVDAPNKAKRESGMLVKKATIVFDDGQKMLIRVKADGTVFQVRLNNKVVPIKNVDNMDKAIGEMVDYVQDNAKAYERAKLQREKRRRITVDPPAVTTTRQEKLAHAKEQLTELSSSNTSLEEQHAQLTATYESKLRELQQAEADLAAEEAKTEELQRTLDELTGQGA